MREAVFLVVSETDDSSCSLESVGGVLRLAASYCTAGYVTQWYARV